jgi:hypothetical protein
MAWFKRRDRKTGSDTPQGSLPDTATRQQTSTEGPRFWIDHGFTDGDRVRCATCGMALVVRLIKFSPSVVATADALAGVPMICGDCGRLFCVDCATRRDANRPSCDRCERIGGVTGLMR